MNKYCFGNIIFLLTDCCCVVYCTIRMNHLTCVVSSHCHKKKYLSNFFKTVINFSMVLFIYNVYEKTLDNSYDK